MKSGICYIVSAGDFSVGLLPEIGEDDLLIAADAGYLPLCGAGITPDCFVGDGDSLGYIPDLPDAARLPSVKNDTDTVAAVKIGYSRGYRRFRLYGALGGKRFSHSVANVQTLLYIESLGGEGEIVDENCTVSLLTDKTKGDVSLPCGGYFSLFALGGDAEVSIGGAKYLASHVALSPSFPLGVSNEPFDGCAVRVHSGKVLLVYEASRDEKEN